MPSSKSAKLTTFADYKPDGRNWITLATGEYYPDILKDACELYKPVLVLFGQLLRSSESSARLFIQIAEQTDGWMRVQLARVFRKYVSPETPVEMLKQKSKAARICEEFGSGFRRINEVQAAFALRSVPDEALCALLWEYKDRGKKGYDLTERFFAMFRETFPDLPLSGPERAGKDILLGEIFPNYPKPDRPVDFIIRDPAKGDVLAVGLARYDGDRGGAQEDDRTGGYRNCADEILGYARKHGLRTKVVFINDGPGLLLGSMWDDYAALERSHKGRILVATLRMVPVRLTRQWLAS
ncbi:MAG: bstEII [Verrucomicrobia bacterium]|nr:bstEII [Verrucomicrobiota bacterium]